MKYFEFIVLTRYVINVPSTLFFAIFIYCASVAAAEAASVTASAVLLLRLWTGVLMVPSDAKNSNDSFYLLYKESLINTSVFLRPNYILLKFFTYIIRNIHGVLKRSIAGKRRHISRGFKKANSVWMKIFEWHIAFIMAENG